MVGLVIYRLQVYILDYMKKNNMHTAADVFAAEANVVSNPIGMSSFLEDLCFLLFFVWSPLFFCFTIFSFY